MIKILFLFIITIGLNLPAQEKFTIEDCYQYASKNSPALKKLQNALSNSKFDTMIQRAVFDLNIFGSANRNDDFRTNSSNLTLRQEVPGGINITATGALNSNEIAATQTSSMSVTISKRLLGGGSMEASLEVYRNSLVRELVSRNFFSREQRRIHSRIKSDFYNIIQNIQSLAVEKTRLETAKKNLEHAIERENPLDIATAKIEIPQTELNVLRIEKNIKSRLDDLKVLIGMSPDDTLQINEEFNFEVLKFDVKADLMFAEQNDEFFLNNSLNKEILERALRVSGEQTQIDVDLIMTQSFRNSSDTNAHLGSDDQFFGINVGWTFGRRAEKARLAKSKNNLDDNAIDKYVLRQNKHNELKKLSRNLEETEKSIKIQEQRIDINKTQIELYKDRWENGQIGILEYIRSQNTLESSKVQLIRLKTDYMNLVNQYIFSIGK